MTGQCELISISREARGGGLTYFAGQFLATLIAGLTSWESTRAGLLQFRNTLGCRDGKPDDSEAGDDDE